MSGSERRNILIDGRTVWYRAAGEGPPVILVHGLSGSTRWWERNVPVLARHFRVYVIDLPGFGENRRAYRFELVEASARLVAWMDAVGIERASIVGHSMGGFIAADLAAAAPDRIERLVLVDAAARPYDRRFWQPAWGSIDMARRLPLRFWPILIADAMRAGPVTLRRATRAVLGADLRPRLELIRTPTLVIWGARDRLVPLEYGQALAETLPNARLEIIDRAGHNSMWEQPDEFNRLVINFLMPNPAPDRLGNSPSSL